MHSERFLSALLLSEFGDKGFEQPLLLHGQMLESHTPTLDPLVAKEDFAGFDIGHGSEGEISQEDPIAIDQ